eukprot:TRINITY_DN4516_c0_g1_i2.p2 TRINITY_DN4516_c0_g1~~TRINITY_DN4516_c0_g1_i2.p2  ORF type:complete len:309 (+),score=72.56 TRINITY_DN4516_c0_g1_i2:1551-2477(+)
MNWQEIEFDDLLGEGAFGKVYKGKWRNADVAVKVITGAVLGGAEKEIVRKLRAEAETMTHVANHPNIVNFVGAVTSGEHLCLVTAYAAGGALNVALRSETFPMHRKIQIMHDAAIGIQHLHKEGVIHRDIAARNILLGNAGEVLVADFGLSRMLEEGQAADMTKSNFGPVPWLAPEAIANYEYSEASDVFSFGVLMWEILHDGEIPWSGTPLMKIAAKVTSGKRLSLKQIDDESLLNIIKSAFNADPLKRLKVKKMVFLLKTRMDELAAHSDEGVSLDTSQSFRINAKVEPRRATEKYEDMVLYAPLD